MGSSTPSSTSPDQGDANSVLVHEASRYRFLQVVGPVALIVGTVGNILVLIILRKPVFTKNPLTVFFRTLAVVDILLLWLGLLRHIVFGFTGLDVRLISTRACWIHSRIIYILGSSDNWILVALTATRVVFLKCPHGAPGRCNKHVLRKVLVTMLVLNTIYYGIILEFVLKMAPGKDGTHKQHTLLYCGVHEGDARNLYPIIDVIVYFFLPAILIVILNCYLYVIYRRIKRSHTRQVQFQTYENGRVRYWSMTVMGKTPTSILVNDAGSEQVSAYRSRVAPQSQPVNQTALPSGVISNKTENRVAKTTNLNTNKLPEDAAGRNSGSGQPDGRALSGSRENASRISKASFQTSVIGYKKRQASLLPTENKTHAGNLVEHKLNVTAEDAQGSIILQPAGEQGSRKAATLLRSSFQRRASKPKASYIEDTNEGRSSQSLGKVGFQQRQEPSSKGNSQLVPEETFYFDAASNMNKADVSPNNSISVVKSEIFHVVGATKIKDASLSLPLFLACLAFITLQGFQAVYSIVYALKSQEEKEKDRLTDRDSHLWLHVFTTVSFVHNAINFLVYLACGSRFQQEFRHLFRSILHPFGMPVADNARPP